MIPSTCFCTKFGGFLATCHPFDVAVNIIGTRAHAYISLILWIILTIFVFFILLLPEMIEQWKLWLSKGSSKWEFDNLFILVRLRFQTIFLFSITCLLRISTILVEILFVEKITMRNFLVLDNFMNFFAFNTCYLSYGCLVLSFMVIVDNAEEFSKSGLMLRHKYVYFF